MSAHRHELLAAGQRIGLMGGSFNPAHEGHLHVARMCLKSLALDRIWWLVSPQNPLKSTTGMAPLATRLAGARRLVAQSGEKRITVTDIETRLHTTRTIDTLRALKRRHAAVDFVWLMGADNMLQLPRWAKWREITREVPLAVYPRPGYTLKARLSPAALMLREATLDVSDAACLAGLRAPALVFLQGREHRASATAIRAARVIKA